MHHLRQRWIVLFSCFPHQHIRHVDAFTVFVNHLENSVGIGNGEEVARCLSADEAELPGGDKLPFQTLSDDDVGKACARARFSPEAGVTGLDEIAAAAVVSLREARKANWREAFLLYKVAFEDFLSKLFLPKKNDSSWLIPCLMTMAKGIRRRASEADLRSGSHTRDDAISPLMQAFRGCISDRNLDPQDSKKLAAMYMAVTLIKHCFEISNMVILHEVKRSVVAQEDEMQIFGAQSDLVAFNYYRGLMVARRAQGITEREEADRGLEYALMHCPQVAYSNRRRILQNMVPLRMRMGSFPNHELLRKYNLEFFSDYCLAIRSGNAELYDRLMKRDMDAFTVAELVLPMEKCRLLVYRQIVKNLVTHLGLRRVPFHMVRFCMGSFGTNKTDEEVEFMLLRLIEEGLVKGIVIHRTGDLIVVRDPTVVFPPLK